MWRITLTCDIGDPATGDPCPETALWETYFFHAYEKAAHNADWRRIKGRGWACPRCREGFR